MTRRRPPNSDRPPPVRPAAPAVRLRGRPAIRLAGALEPGDEALWQSISLKPAALLALVIDGGGVGRSRLRALLWPDAEEAKAQANLRGALRNLRRAAGAELFDGQEVLTLRPEVAHDLHDLHAAGLAVEPLARATPEALDDDTASMLRAPAECLSGLDASALDELQLWLDERRAVHRASAVAMALHQARRHEQAGRRAPALAWLRHVVVLDPTNEGHLLQALGAMARLGERAEALALIARAGERLAQASGEPVSAALQRLATAIECDRPPAASEPAGLPVVLGPTQVLGRDADREVVRAAWQAGAPVLLLGEPGVGKTTFLTGWGHADREHRVLCPAQLGDAQVPFATVLRLLPALLAHGLSGLDEDSRSELARLLPALGPVPSRPARLPALAAAFTALVRQAALAGLNAVLVDDLQWADDLSLTLIVAAASDRADAAPHWLLARHPVRLGGPGAGERAAAPGPAQVLHAALAPIGARLNAVPPDSPAAAGAADGSIWQVHTLSAWQDEDLRTLVADLGASSGHRDAWARWLREAAAGSPRRTVELLRELPRYAPGGLMAPPPERVPDAQTDAELHQLLAWRMAGLEAAQADLLRLSALAGPLMDGALACAVLGQGPMAVARTMQALREQALLDEHGRLYSDALRQPLLQALPDAAAKHLHACIARHVQSRLGVGVGVGVEQADGGAGAADATDTADTAGWLARHWRLAGEWGPAAQQYERAALRAERLDALSDALRLWDEAAHARQRALDTAGAHRCRSEAFERSMAVETTERSLERARRLLADARTPLQCATAELSMARVHAHQADWRAATERAERADALASAELVGWGEWGGSPDMTAGSAPSAALPGDEAARPGSRLDEAKALRACALRSRVLLMACLAGSGRHEQALALRPAADALIDAETPPRLRLDHIGMVGAALLMANRLNEAVAAYREALDIAARLDEAAEAMTLASNLCSPLTRLGALEAACDMADEGLRWCGRLGQLDSAAGLNVRLTRCTMYARLGRYAEAIDGFAELAAALREHGPSAMRLTADIQQAALWLDLGQADRTRRHLDAAAALPGASANAWWAAVDVAQRRAAVFGRQANPVEAEPDLLLARCAGHALANRHTLRLALLPDRSPSEALADARQVAAECQALGWWSGWLAARLGEAEVLLRLGDGAAAAALMTACLARVTALPRPGDAPPTRMGDGPPGGAGPARIGMPVLWTLPRVWHLAWRCHRAAGDHGAARVALGEALSALLDGLQPQVPQPWRADFLHRHPLHAELLRLGRESGHAGVPQAARGA